LEVAQTIYVDDDISEDMLFDQEGVGGVYITLQGVRTVLYSGTVTSQQAWSEAANTDGQITAGAMPSSWTALGLVDKLITKTSGTGVGACGWVAADLGSAARYSPLIDANFFAVYDWSVGDTFDVVDLTKVLGSVIVSGTAQVIPIDLSFSGSGETGAVFNVVGEGICFPIYCEFACYAAQTMQGGYCDYIGCRLATESGDLYSAWQATTYLDACLSNVRIRGEEDGTIGVLSNSLSQGKTGGGNVGASFRNTQTVFTEWAWYAVYDQPTTDPALYVSSGSSVFLPNVLWGNGGGSNYAVVVLGAAHVEYLPGTAPTYGPSAVQDTNIGGLLRPYASLPVNNLSKACGIILQ
jgi:hypothetical protein